MKATLKQIGLAIALIATGNAAIASGTPKVEIKPLEGKNAILEIEQANNSHFEITIKNKTGEVVYYSETEGDTAKYQHVYDFSEYKPGVYDMIVANDNLVTEHQFTIANGSVSVGEKQMTQKPFFAYNSEQSILRIAYLNYPAEKMQLEVYDGNELIYNKALDNSFAVNEGLNLSKLSAGKYQIVLAAGNKNFDFPVNIR